MNADTMNEFRDYVQDRIRAAIRAELSREWGIVVLVDADGNDSVIARVVITNPSRDDLTYGIQKVYRLGEFTEPDAVIMMQGALAAVALDAIGKPITSEATA